MDIERRYLYVGQRRVHLRLAGEGPVLAVLHPLPGSSAAVVPLIRELARGRTVIAPDLPGYGESAPLDVERPTMGDYAEATEEVLEALGLQRADVLGSHTGAKVALELGRRRPDRVGRLILEGLGVHTSRETRELTSRYTPSLAPEWDGSHLVRAWSLRRDMHVFWPWFRREAEARLMVDLPAPEELHDEVVDLLRAGAGWGRGYQASFRYDPREGLAGLPGPALVVASPVDPLFPHLERLGELPATIRVARAPSAGELLEAVRSDLAGGEASPRDLRLAPGRSARGEVRRSYLRTSAGQLLARRCGSGPERPLVMLHASPVSSAYLEPYLLALGEDREVITFDNPGNGDSDALAEEAGLPDVATVVGEALDTLGLEEVDLFGSHTGALIAIELSLARAERIGRLMLDGVTLLDAGDRQEYLSRYVERMEARWDGGQLAWAWNLNRDQQLWWPWYRRIAAAGRRGVSVPSTERLHATVVEFLKGARTYHRNYRAAFAYPTAERLPLLRSPVLLTSSPTDPLREYLPEAAALTVDSRVRVRPGGTPEQAFAAAVGLYRAFLAGERLPPGPER